MNFKMLSELEQNQYLRGIHGNHIRKEIIYDIINHIEKLQFIKGKLNKDMVVNYILGFTQFDLELLSQLHHYHTEFDYTDEIFNLLNTNNYSIHYKCECEENFILYIINNAKYILKNCTTMANFFLVFKDFLNKEMVIDIYVNIKQNQYVTNTFYNCTSILFGKEFMNQLQFIDKLEVV